MSDFLSALQTASFNGVPFKARSIDTTSSRKLAIHRYPFQDGGWPEDLGRDLTAYSIDGYLVGDDAPALAALLKAMADFVGSGILIHPALGAVPVNLARLTQSVRADALRVIWVRLDFIENNAPSIISTIISTILETLTFATTAEGSCLSDWQASIAPTLPAGPEPEAEAAAVITAAGVLITTASTDPAAAINAVSTLQGNYGRYVGNGVSVPAPADATPTSLIQGVVLQQQALAQAITAAVAVTASLSTTTDIMTPLIAMMTALVGTTNSPVDQVRLLLSMISFTYDDSIEGTGLAGDIAIIRDATASAVRRAAIIAIAQVTTAYKAISYQDMANVRLLVTEAIDGEILVAGDEGDDQTYMALRNLRASIAADLTARGANLAKVQTFRIGRPLPALVVAYALYGDATRTDELVRFANPADPAFMPIQFQALQK